MSQELYNRRQELVGWIRRSLGVPIYDELPIAPEQIYDCISEAVLYSSEFMGRVGNEDNLAIIWTQPDCVIQNQNLIPSKDNRLIKNSDYANNPTGTTLSPSGGVIATYKQEYQLPRNVLAVGDILSAGGSGRQYGDVNAGASNDDESLMSVASWSSAFGGMGLGGLGGLGGGVASTSTASGLFVPGSSPGFDAFGTRGGVRAAGGGIDLISFMLGMQYLEMVRQMFTVKLRAEFLEARRRVRFSPAPPSDGLIVIMVNSRVEQEWLYENLFVRRLALAYTKRQLAYNFKLYKDVKLPGGVTIDADFYLEESKADIEKLEKEIMDNRWGEPPRPFFVG